MPDPLGAPNLNGRVDVDWVGGIALLALGPQWNPTVGASELQSIWRQFAGDPSVKGVITIASSAGEDCEPTTSGSGHRETVGPKTNGLLKPFGVGVRGVVRNEVLQLVGEADVVVATPEATFADTSVASGMLPIHAMALKALLPPQEMLRIALLGEKAPMSCDRALQLELVSVVVPDDELEAEVRRRVKAWVRP
jgi:enoyl-CoA hydratase/carnithine racemase